MSYANKPAAGVRAAYVLKRPAEPSLIKENENKSVILTAEPGEILHG